MGRKDENGLASSLLCDHRGILNAE